MDLTDIKEHMAFKKIHCPLFIPCSKIQTVLRNEKCWDAMCPAFRSLCFRNI